MGTTAMELIEMIIVVCLHFTQNKRNQLLSPPPFYIYFLYLCIDYIYCVRLFQVYNLLFEFLFNAQARTLFILNKVAKMMLMLLLLVTSLLEECHTFNHNNNNL